MFFGELRRPFLFFLCLCGEIFGVFCLKVKSLLFTEGFEVLYSVFLVFALVAFCLQSVQLFRLDPLFTFGEDSFSLSAEQFGGNFGHLLFYIHEWKQNYERCRKNNIEQIE